MLPPSDASEAAPAAEQTDRRIDGRIAVLLYASYRANHVAGNNTVMNNVLELMLACNF